MCSSDLRGEGDRGMLKIMFMLMTPYYRAMAQSGSKWREVINHWLTLSGSQLNATESCVTCPSSKHYARYRSTSTLHQDPHKKGLTWFTEVYRKPSSKELRVFLKIGWLADLSVHMMLGDDEDICFEVCASNHIQFESGE